MTLTAKNIHCAYNGRPVLYGIDVEVSQGEVLAVAGPNGAGKTTLLKCLLAVLPLQGGEVLVDGAPLSEMDGRTRARRLAYVPQATPAKFPISVFDAVLLGRRPYLGWRPSNNDLQLTDEILKTMGLEALAGHDFDRLSGGEKQKVILARAFAQEALYMLLDEPTSNLDLKHQLEVLELVRTRVKRRGIGAIVAIHDLNLAIRFADRVLLLNRGEIFANGSAEEVLTSSNIREVYEVDVEEVLVRGKRCLVPIGAADRIA
ncbi:MAG: ABC transporter ATP-binding protein [Desulfarculaceae bacterium]